MPHVMELVGAEAAAAQLRAVCRKFSLTQTLGDENVISILTAKLGFMKQVSADGKSFDLVEDPAAAAEWLAIAQYEWRIGGPDDVLFEDDSDEEADEEPSKHQVWPCIHCCAAASLPPRSSFTLCTASDVVFHWYASRQHS